MSRPNCSCHIERDYRYTADDPQANAIVRCAMHEAAPELVEALQAMTPSMPPKDAPCHLGICSQEKCGFCSRIATARAALTKAGGQ